MRTVRRTFHPIGQGAFYSERHDGVNIVYDCGNWKREKKAKSVVERGFAKGESIDVLFISHFDYDHISLIPVLMTRCTIKKVVMPLLHDDERIILSRFYEITNRSDVLQIINDPRGYFGEENIVEVEGETENPVLEGREDPVEIAKVGSKIKGGRSITVKHHEWIFIPFNHENASRRNELIAAFNKQKLDIDKFKEDIAYGLNNRKKVKAIYESLSGNINQNAMTVYSGSLRQQALCIMQYNTMYTCANVFSGRGAKRSSCVYTGDADLNHTKIRLIYAPEWGCVSTIQVPHHGDHKAYENSAFAGAVYSCPISFGVSNTYGHPKQSVIVNLLANGSIPIFVTENARTEYIEILFYA